VAVIAGSPSSALWAVALTVRLRDSGRSCRWTLRRRLPWARTV